MCELNIYSLRAWRELLDLLELIFNVAAEPIRNFSVPTLNNDLDDALLRRRLNLLALLLTHA